MARIARPVQLPTGNWRIRWRDGAGLMRSQTYPTHKEADKALHALMAEAEAARQGLAPPATTEVAPAPRMCLLPAPLPPDRVAASAGLTRAAPAEASSATDRRATTCPSDPRAYPREPTGAPYGDIRHPPDKGPGAVF
jgi:hypothetical protein